MSTDRGLLKLRDNLWIKFQWINEWGEAVFDFHLTPVLTIARAVPKGGVAWSLGLEWGHWAIGIGLLRLTENP